jgi:hypothetical protein
MPTIKQLSRIFSKDDSLNRLQDQLASALNPILREIKGDLSGPLESPTVGALQGRPIANTAPITGQALIWDGLQWAPGASGGTVNSVTATSPLASSGGTTPDISLTGVIDAAHGGTGLSTSGTYGYVLTANGMGGWTSSPAPGANTVDLTIVLLMAATGTTGSTLFPDTSAYQATLTPYGNTQIAATPTQFGGGSGYFDGNGDYITAPSNPVYAFGTGNFTIEGWIYPLTYGGGGYSILGGTIVDNQSYGGDPNSVIVLTTTSGNIIVWSGGPVLTSTAVVPLNAWTFFTVVRSANVVTIYINGNVDSSTAFTTNLTSTSMTIGSVFDGRAANTYLKFNGYMNDLRLSNVARYTTSFTPPTSPFPSSVAGYAFPIGAAGGVLGYPGSTYPNPSGLAPTFYAPPENPFLQGYQVIPVKTLSDSNTISIRPDQPNNTYNGQGQSIELTGSVGSLSQPYYGSKGGSAGVRGGKGYPAGPFGGDRSGGAAYVYGGAGGPGGPGGDAIVQGGFGDSGVKGGDAAIRGGSTSGFAADFGDVYVGTETTNNIYIGNPTPSHPSYSPPAVYVSNQQVDLLTTLPTTNQFLKYNGTKWVPANIPPVSPSLGNTLVVDAVNGNDLTGTVNGLPFATPEAAIAYINTHSLTGVTVWIMPSTYALSAGITVPDTCSLRGLSTQTTKLTLTGSNPGGTVTMLTMGENSRVEDLTLTLTSTNATTNLVGVNTPGNSSTTSKLRTCVVTVNNNSLAYTTSTNVYGIYDNGSGTLGPTSFSFNFTRGVTVNVFSNGGGNKRAVYVGTTNDITFRDTNFYVAAPVSSLSTGSYVGVETTDAGCSVQFRTCSISGPSTAGSYTGSDILQTTPGTGFINNGIQLGPGCDLVNKTAGGKPFTTYVTPITLEYGLKANLVNSPHYLWPGVQTAADATEIFYRFQQKSICQGMSIYLRTAPGAGKSITVTVRKSTTSTPGSSTATTITATISGTNKNADHYISSVDFAAGEYLSVEIDGTAGNAAQDLVVELDLF